MIFDGIDLSVHNYIVSMQTHVQLDFLFDGICVEDKHCWAMDRALGNSRCYIVSSGMRTINRDSLNSIEQKVIYPYQD